MTTIRTASIGSYPRIGEEKDQQRHRRAMAHLQNKEISAHAFGDVEQSVIQEIVREQITMGLDEVTDGLVAWQDPISHFCRNVKGVKITGLMRYFDTNFYYRVPEITGTPRLGDPILAAEYEYARSVSSKPVRAVLTGPYTLAMHVTSQKKPYDKWATRLAFFTDLIQKEIAALVAKGALLIQIDEPALARRPEDLPLLAGALTKIAGKFSDCRLILALYFYPLAPLYAALRDLPVYSLNLDFTADGKRLWETILASKPGPLIGLGLLDGRQTKLEPMEPLVKIIRSWLDKASPPVVTLTPSCGLEFLPRAGAAAKLKLLNQLRDHCIAGLSGAPVHA